MGLTKPRAAQIYNLDYKQSTRVITTTNITLAGGAPNSVDGVNLSLNDRILVTGQNTGSQNGIYLVTTLGTGSNGTWARTSDTNETGEIEAGMIVMVTEGTVYADTQWKLTTNDPITVGTTALTFVQNYSANSISGGTSNVVVATNAAVTISSAGTANVVSVGNTAVTFTGNLNPSANVTYSLGNTANRWKDLWLANSTLYIGEVTVATTGSALTINGANVLTGNAGAAFSTTGNVTGGNILTGGLVSATSTIISAANITGGNLLTGGLVSATSTITSAANITGGNITTAGLVTATGNVTGGNLITSGKVYGLELNSTQSSGDEGGQINLALAATNTTLSGNVVVDIFQNKFRIFEGGGTARGAYIDLTQAGAGVSTNLLAGGGGGTPGGANTNVQFNDGGTFGGNAQFTYNKATNLLTVGNVSANSNGLGTNYAVGDDAYIGDINTADTVGIKGQQNPANAYIVFGNSDSTGKLGRAGTGPLTYAGAFSATSNITGGNILTGGLISATGNVTANNITINNNAIITGNLTVNGTETIFNVANLTVNDKDIIVANNVTGGANVNGAGIQAGNPATATWFFNNATTSWQSNIGITPTANGTLALGGASNYWGNAFITAASITGNVTGGNILTAGLITATGNVQAGNVRTAGLITATGNIDVGNVRTAGLITATGNIDVGNVRTAGLISAAGALITGGDHSLTGNIVDTGTLWINTTANGNINLNVNGTGQTNIPTGILSVTSNVQAGNLRTAGLISSTGNIDAGNLRTAGLITATGNIDVGNVRTAGLISATSTITSAANVIGGNLTTAGLITATGNAIAGNILTAGFVSATGNLISPIHVSTANVTLTSSAANAWVILTPTGTGTIIASRDITNGQANGVGNIGSSTGYFNTVFAKATSAQYADLAEMYSAGAQYEPGTVVIFGGSYEVEISATSHANTVAGVVSTNPSYIMNAGQTGSHVVAVALQGRVPTRVVGHVRKGDRMVSSHIPGVATVLDPAQYDPGCIIGKALVTHEPILDEHGDEVPGLIEIVVGRV